MNTDPDDKVLALIGAAKAMAVGIFSHPSNQETQLASALYDLECSRDEQAATVEPREFVCDVCHRDNLTTVACRDGKYMCESCLIDWYGDNTVDRKLFDMMRNLTSSLIVHCNSSTSPAWQCAQKNIRLSAKKQLAALIAQADKGGGK